jgi:hypothetical protein
MLLHREKSQIAGQLRHGFTIPRAENPYFNEALSEHYKRKMLNAKILNLLGKLMEALEISLSKALSAATMRFIFRLIPLGSASRGSGD